MAPLRAAENRDGGLILNPPSPLIRFMKALIKARLVLSLRFLVRALSERINTGPGRRLRALMDPGRPALLMARFSINTTPDHSYSS